MITSPPWRNQPSFWLATLGIILAVLNLSLAWIHTRNGDLVLIMALFWSVVGALLWRRRYQLQFNSDLYSTGAGLLFLLWVLYESRVMTAYDPFIRIQPFLSLLGLGLLASGSRGLWSYRQELSLLMVLALPEGLLAQLLEQWIDVSEVAARATTAMLWYFGFDVTREGTTVILPTGSIEVYRGCSGLKATLELLRLSLMFLIIFPTTALGKLVVPTVAMSLAYGINVVRISLMAVLADAGHKGAFQYWHEGDGSNIFPILSMLLFTLFCIVLIQPHEKRPQRNLQT